jgi:hypothetical protein
MRSSFAPCQPAWSAYMMATSSLGSVFENRSRNSCIVPVLASGMTSDNYPAGPTRLLARAQPDRAHLLYVKERYLSQRLHDDYEAITARRVGLCRHLRLRATALYA